MTKPFVLHRVTAQYGNPFDLHPELRNIWSPVLAEIAAEAIGEAFSEEPRADVGRIFLVTNPDDEKDIWGITGFLPWPDAGDGVLQRVGLRWHGLLPDHRGQGMSLAIIDSMREMAHRCYPEATQLVEFMPISADYAAASTYFENAGFTKWGTPERVHWSSDLWQEYVCDIRMPLMLVSAVSPSFSVQPSVDVSR